MKNFFYRGNDFQPIYLYVFCYHVGWMSCIALTVLKLIPENIAVVIIPLLISAPQGYAYLFNKSVEKKDDPKIP